MGSLLDKVNYDSPLVRRRDGNCARNDVNSVVVHCSDHLPWTDGDLVNLKKLLGEFA